MADEKKIKKYQKLFLAWLGDVETVEKQMAETTEQKKIVKLEKKLNTNKHMVVTNGKKIAEFGGNIKDIIGKLSPRQQEIIKELFHYNTDSENFEEVAKRSKIINDYKLKIKKIKEAETKYSPYDMSIPVKEKLSSKLYKIEVSFGNTLFRLSEADKELYEPVWNYKEHIATSSEFTDEEKAILTRCYKLGEEYDKYLDEKFAIFTKIGGALIEKSKDIEAWGEITQAKVWCKNMYDDVFQDFIKIMNPDKKYTRQELKQESIELTKRFFEFIANKEELNKYMSAWRQFMENPSLAGIGMDEKSALALDAAKDVVGLELAGFMYIYDGVGDKARKNMDSVLKYTYEELGLE